MAPFDLLTLLKSSSADDRLRAARLLAHDSSPTTTAEIQSALQREKNKWVKSALRKALQVSNGQTPSFFPEADGDSEEDKVLQQIRADAVQETTMRLVHEIRPIVGRLEVRATQEISDYEKSETRRELERLNRLMEAIDSLSRAASAPVFKDFDFSQLVGDLVKSECVDDTQQVQMVGPTPFVIVGASGLLDLVIENAVRNALESSCESGAGEPVVVTWGETDIDYWISVLDHGKGLPVGGNNVFEIGSTTKKGHLGMGLALVKQASISLSGTVSLTPREPCGAKFELRWPKQNV